MKKLKFPIPPPEKQVLKPGLKIGRLTALSYVKRGLNSDIWKWLCDCGNTTETTVIRVRSGNTKSCGCLHTEAIFKASFRHGHAPKGNQTPEYTTWVNIIQRTSNKNRPDWQYYGGRGIKVCERWLHSFENFFADMGPKPPKLTLERLDNNGNYEPSNCKWATWKEQRANQRKL